MKKILAVTGLLVVGALLGWFGHVVWSSYRPEPAEVVADGWKALVALQTDVDRSPRQPEAVVSSGRIMLSTQTLALALHYDQLSTGEKERLKPFILRARALPRGDAYQSLAVLDCIEEAGLHNTISETCITRSIQRQGREPTPE